MAAVSQSAQTVSTKGLSRFRLLAIPVILTLALGGGVSGYVFNSYNALKKLQTQDLRIQELSGKITYLDEVLTASARLGVATGDPQWEARYRQADTELSAAIAEAERLAPAVFTSDAFTQTSLANAKLVELENQAFQLLRQGQRQQAATLLASPEYQTQKKTYIQGLEATTTALKQAVNTTIQAQGQQAFSMMLFVGIALVVLLVAWIAVLRTLNRYVRTLNETQQVIIATTSRLANSLDQQERATTEQAGSIHQTTTSMDELAASSRLSAEQAEAAASGAAQVLAFVQGDRYQQQTEVDSLQGRVRHIAEQISRLSEQTHKIADISTLVSRLAGQTNMLALNAAVEAVRAGEHGRGFSVVAGEIRKLAEQSKQSAEHINTLVRDIQTATNQVMTATAEGNQIVETVVSAVNGITLNTQQISLTSKQQAVAIQQVLAAMNTINQAASNTAQSVAQTKIDTQNLSDAALKLQSVT